MSRRNFFSAGPLGGSRPTARLAGRPRARLGQGGGNGCVVPGTGEHPVFQYNPTTKVCGVFWMDPGGSYPDCVRAPEGYYGGGHNGWIPPSCMPEQAPTSPEPPVTPPAPGGGLPPAVACPMGNGLFSLVSYIDGSLIAENISRDQFGQYTSDVTDLASGVECSDDSRCAPVCNVSMVEPPPYYGEPPDVAETPVSAPVSAPAPTPGPVAPPAAPVSPGSSLPIVPGPFPSVPQPPSLPIAPGPIPSSAPPPVPQRGFAPAAINPSCQSTPYKAPMFSSTTRATRPDEFTEKQQWTR